MTTATRTLRFGLALALALAAVLLAATSFDRKVGSFQPLGFAGVPAGAGLRVAAVGAGTEGLAPGDLILLAGGGDVGSEDALRRRLRESPRTTLLVQRGERLLHVPYARPPLDLDTPYLVMALIGALYLLIGLYTLLRQRGQAQGFLFYLWTLLSATAYLVSATPPLDAAYRLLWTVDACALILLAPVTLHLFLELPGRLAPARWSRRAVPFLYLPAAALLALQLDYSLTGGRLIFGPPTPGSVVLLDRLVLAQLALYALAAVAVLVARLRGDRGWHERRQAQWMAVGLAGGYLPFLLLYALPWVAGLRWPEVVTSAAVLPLAVVPLTFAYAILRYKLWDIELVVRSAVASTLTLLLGLFGFSLVNLLISRGVPAELALARNLLSFSAGLGIAALLVPTRRGLSSALERFQYRGTFGKRRGLSELGSELLHERDLGRLCDALLRQIEEGVALEGANLLLAHGGLLHPVRPDPGLPAPLALDALGEEVWREGHRALSGLTLPTEPEGAAQALYLAGYRYVFPLAVRGTRVGLVLAGWKEELQPLNSEDLELIRHLLNQAALAIENAQLLGQLNSQLAEVTRLQRYAEQIFESSPAGIAVVDGDGRVVSANAAFARLAGVERAGAVGRRLGELLPVEPLPSPAAGPVEVGFCDAAGRERYLQLSVSAFDQGAGGRYRVLVALDVSDRVEMENALKEKDRLAALGMLAAGVAHEVNTPITGISSYAQMLLSETAESDPHYDILKKVERQTFRAARIVNNLLEFARNRRNEAGPVPLRPLIAECLELLSDRFAKRRIELVWRPPADEVVVDGCDGELQQVLTNLFMNAQDAMAESGGRLTVELEADSERARVHVRDTGPGVPPEKLERIFQPFYSTKLARGGTGLGLSISAEIVRRHGGALTVASRPGEGACFTVELPRHAPAPGALAPPAAAAE
ncbi:MAG TPA: ATP-binding protein [Thermoanaerobaculia bacterium]|nr:ATP-binding protein [Thermoanaerobaculia bacterium]